MGLETKFRTKKKKEEPKAEPIQITIDHLKVIFHVQWLQTTILFGLLGIGGWTLIVNLINEIIYQIAFLLLFLMFLLIAYYKLYKAISPEDFLG